jgi:hypothetical protein
VDLVALGIELLGLFERIAGCGSQSECVLATAHFEPEEKVTRVPLEGLLKQLQGKGEVFVVRANPGCQPSDEPIARRQKHCFFETIIGARFLSSQ